MKLIMIPKGMKIACGKLVHPVGMRCGDEEGYLCGECKAWNDANCTKDEGGQDDKE